MQKIGWFSVLQLLLSGFFLILRNLCHSNPVYAYLKVNVTVFRGAAHVCAYSNKSACLQSVHVIPFPAVTELASSSSSTTQAMSFQCS